MFQNESNKLNHIMQNNLIDKQLVDTTMAQCGVSNLDDASIRDTVKIANLLEKATGEKFIRMEMGVPGLPPSAVGVKAEIAALQNGIASLYPDINGLPELKKEYSLLVVGIGNNQFRAQVYEKAKSLGYAFPNIIAPSAYVSPFAEVGCGCVVLQNACIQNGASVGSGVLLNAGTEVHCDATIGDYALIYTSSVIRTGATVGKFARIGSNCTICNNATVLDSADVSDCTAVH
mgnify:CR=1 FL=1